MPPRRGGRKKSLLIGINYTGQSHALQGCEQDVAHIAEFLDARGYSNNRRDQVIMTEDLEGPFYPTGHNLLAAMDWLVSEPHTTCFLHYSGHGGTIRAPDRDSGFDDTIVPIDYERTGQINSDSLHRHLVSALHPSSTLFVIFDCCHSGSAIELPYVYRTDDEGNMNFMDNVQAGMSLLGDASQLLRGGLNFNKRSFQEAKDLYQGATSFFSGLKGMGGDGGGEEGLDEQDDFGVDWSREHKAVTMFSGCKDEQTSADASIGGRAQGAMSWAFLQTMRERGPEIDYVETLQMTRQRLKESSYAQIPQLSVGFKDFQIEQPLMV